MTKTLQQPFPPPTPNAIASYSYNDIAEGTGIVNFYPIVGKTSAGTTYDLISETLDGWLIETPANESATYTFQTKDFNLPRYVKGTAYFSAHFYSASGTTNVSIKIQKWDGATATDLTGTILSANGSNLKNHAVFLKVPITTETIIKKGESIRAIVVWTQSSGDTYLGWSPTNQTSPTGNLTNTQMIIGIPFRLDDVV